jgi:hypothetical protein
VDRHEALRTVPKCETCKWFAPIWRQDVGECRRNAPTLRMTGSLAERAWPPVNSAHFCGQHEAIE